MFLFQAVRSCCRTWSSMGRRIERGFACVWIGPTCGSRSEIRGSVLIPCMEVVAGIPGGFGLFNIRERLELLGGR